MREMGFNVGTIITVNFQRKAKQGREIGGHLCGQK